MIKYMKQLYRKLKSKYKRNHPKVIIDFSGASTVDILEVLLSDKGRESLEMCAKFAREQGLRSVTLRDTKDYKALYQDLIMQVARKYPEETRHETAKRYIINAENTYSGPAKSEN